MIKDNKLNELVQKFEDSGNAINTINSHLSNFVDSIEKLNENIIKVEEYKDYLKDELLNSLQDSAKTVEDVHQAFKGQQKNLDSQIITLNTLSTTFKTEVQKTVNNFSELLDQVAHFNEHLEPNLKKVNDLRDLILKIDLKTIFTNQIEVLNQIRDNILKSNNQLVQETSQMNSKTSEFISENKIELSTLNKNIDNNYKELLTDTKKYSEKMGTVIETNQTLIGIANQLDKSSAGQITMFKKLCDMWADERLKESAFKKKQSFWQKYFYKKDSKKKEIKKVTDTSDDKNITKKAQFANIDKKENTKS